MCTNKNHYQIDNTIPNKKPNDSKKNISSYSCAHLIDQTEEEDCSTVQVQLQGKLNQTH